MSYELIISPDAQEEMNISKAFYEKRKTGLGKEFAIEVNRTFDRILSNPVQFPKVKHKQVRKAILKRFPFGVYFAIKDEIINVLAVYNFSRSPKLLNKRF